MRITSDQNVGIGTSTPTQKLDVAGNVHLSGKLNCNGCVTSTDLASGVIGTTRTVTVYTHPGNYNFAQGTAVLAPLDNTGATQSATFTTSGDLLVTYEAECAVGAPAGNTVTWLNIDIQLVNIDTGAVITLDPSSGSGDALCTSNGSVGIDGWERSSITGFATGVAQGNYAIKIRANVENGVSGDRGWLGDSTLVIWK